MNINTKRTSDFILKNISNYLSENFVNNSFLNNKLKIKKQIHSILKDITDKNIIKNYEVSDVNSLWFSWSYKQKFIWFWKQKLKFGKNEIQKFDNMCELIFINDTNDFKVYNIFNDTFKKYWYEYNPKSIVIVDVYWQCVNPIQKINLTCKVKK